jgi:hypothetical protein
MQSDDDDRQPRWIGDPAREQQVLDESLTRALGTLAEGYAVRVVAAPPQTPLLDN